MLCPCGKTSDTAVKDSRPVEDRIRRRRICNTCGERFNTYEIIADRVSSQFPKDKIDKLSSMVNMLFDDFRQQHTTTLKFCECNAEKKDRHSLFLTEEIVCETCLDTEDSDCTHA